MYGVIEGVLIAIKVEGINFHEILTSRQPMLTEEKVRKPLKLER